VQKQGILFGGYKNGRIFAPKQITVVMHNQVNSLLISILILLRRWGGSKSCVA
jgi:hypothetical protein